jgi:type I restriction enzyme S subunit
MQKVESNKQRLEKIPALLKRFRQSVLAAAVSGKLTEEWREKNGIIEEWGIMKAIDACETVAGGSTPKGKPFFEKEEIPYLKVYNIVNQKIDFFYKPQYVTRKVHEKELKRCRVYPKDVLMNIVGPPLGKVAIVPDTFPEWNMNQAIVVFRPKGFLSPLFLYYLLCDGKQIKEIEFELRGTAGQSNISLTQCRNFDIPIPRIEEQKEIVRRVEQLFAFADKLEARYAKAKTLLDKLPQSILAKAFRGELVPQDPNDEPASVLLNKIREEKRDNSKPAKS